jgi:hypothetical protein
VDGCWNGCWFWSGAWGKSLSRCRRWLILLGGIVRAVLRLRPQWVPNVGVGTLQSGYPRIQP